MQISEKHPEHYTDSARGMKNLHLFALLIAYYTLLVALHFGSIAPLSVFPSRFIQDFKNHLWRHLILRRVFFRLMQYTRHTLSAAAGCGRMQGVHPDLHLYENKGLR